MENEKLCGNENNDILFELSEKKENDLKLKKILNPSWVCRDCESLQGFCFICKK